MFIEVLKMHHYGYVELEFTSGQHRHKMGTFFIQVPSKVRRSTGTALEIPNSFMCEKLNLPKSSDPLEWYINKEKELGLVAGEVGHPQNIFNPFMNAVGNFFGYDRASEERNWQELMPQI